MNRKYRVVVITDDLNQTREFIIHAETKIQARQKAIEQGARDDRISYVVRIFS